MSIVFNPPFYDTLDLTGTLTSGPKLRDEEDVVIATVDSDSGGDA